MTKLTKLSRSVEGKVALITGSGSGMGRATSYVFAEAGAKVVVSDINEKQIDEVSSEINSCNATCLKQILDVTNQENIERVVANVIKEFGQLDILINNAGISIPTTIDDENYEESWDRTFDVLLKGQVNLIRAALPYIRKSDCGRIVNISSTEGLGATPRISPYTSAKHGVIGLTRSLAAELGSQGITVHPRPDQRHIKHEDVYNIAEVIKTDYNIEGYPDNRLLKIIDDVRPEQVTLVPDAPIG